MGRKITIAAAIIVLAALTVLLFAVVPVDRRPEGGLKDTLFQRGSEETGSVNLVSAIYLGYRAFDTLGETIVMLVSVVGISVLLRGKT